MKQISHIHIILLLSIASILIAGCSHDSQSSTLMLAESLIESHPDSALKLLKRIEKSELGSDGKKARYALLMSMALDKNYIDTTSFDVIQPAIDYYLRKGNPDEKLRTFYYQGRIYQNGGDRDNAMQSYAKALALANQCNDSACLARVLVAQGGLYHEFYDLESYTNCYLNAAEIYKALSLKDQEIDCLLNAFNGAILSDNRDLAKQMQNACEDFSDSLDSELRSKLNGYKLSALLNFGSRESIMEFLNSGVDYADFDINGLLNLASAYNYIEDYNKAKDLLDYINHFDHNHLKFLATAVTTNEGLGNYRDALFDYRDFNNILEKINTSKFDQKIQSINDKFQFELEAQENSRFKTKVLWSCIGGSIIVLMGTFIFILLIQRNKNQKRLAIQKAKTIELKNIQLKSDKVKALQQSKIVELENNRLKSESERLILENQNLQLEREKKSLETENLIHRIEMLEHESALLKDIIESHTELPDEVQDTIKERIGILNGLVVGYLTNNNRHNKSYEEWIQQLTENIEQFMNSNRLAFKATHPRFIQYFEHHNLTVNEINYVCLYAIGLKGKDVGAYMKRRSHVNISSAIRKKLGIDKHETNIGIYVRHLLTELSSRL